MVANPTLQYILYEALAARCAAAAGARRAAAAAAAHGGGGGTRRRQGGGAGQLPAAAARPAALAAGHVFLLSAVAKLGATLATYPLLVVKNRLQVGWWGGGWSGVCA
jgi:adenine nucleotide transporter 17